MEVYRKTLKYLKLLHLIYYTDDIGSLILAVFYQTISFYNKKAILAEFRKLAKSLRIQIIFATKAIRLSVNILDICQVVIYIILYPKPHFSLLLQRGGQANYNNKKAKVIFLFEYWCFGKRDLPLKLKLKVLNRLNSYLQKEAYILFSSTSQP